MVTKIYDIFAPSKGKDDKTRWLPVGTLFVNKKDNGKISRSIRLNLFPEQRYMVFESNIPKKEKVITKTITKEEEPKEVEEFDIEDE
jgi:hypothetical protein